MVKGNLLKLQPQGLEGNFTHGLDGVLRRGLLFVEWIVIIYNWQNLGKQRSWNFMIYQTSILVSSKHLTLSSPNQGEIFTIGLD